MREIDARKSNFVGFRGARQNVDAEYDNKARTVHRLVR